MTETGIAKGQCLFGITYGGTDGDTDFDMASNKPLLDRLMSQELLINLTLREIN